MLVSFSENVDSCELIHHRETFVSGGGALPWGVALLVNRPFPSSLAPLFQSESKCETILMKMTLICMKKKLRVELTGIFIWKVSHLDSLWNGGTRELGDGLLTVKWCSSDLLQWVVQYLCSTLGMRLNHAKILLVFFGHLGHRYCTKKICCRLGLNQPKLFFHFGLFVNYKKTQFNEGFIRIQTPYYVWIHE